MDYFQIETPIGKLTIAADGDAVTNVWFGGETPGFVNANTADSRVSDCIGNLVKETTDTCALCTVNCALYNVSPVLRQAAAELSEYFLGKRKVFTVPLRPVGGVFHMRIWEAMRGIPYGETVSYGRLAFLAGNAKAARAAGAACNRNPIPIFIPCHRVVGANGNLTGFRAGLDVKRKLLELERISCQPNP